RSPAAQPRALPALCRPPGPGSDPRGDRRPPQLHRHPRRRRRGRGLGARTGSRADDSARRDPALESGRRAAGGGAVSREIVEAVKVLEQEKGIDSETLMSALEDALLSAYKKTPGAARYARVDLDRDTADFRVFELILPPELEEKLLAQVAEEAEQEIDPETGERREPEEPDLDPELLAPYEDQIE